MEEISQVRKSYYKLHSIVIVFSIHLNDLFFSFFLFFFSYRPFLVWRKLTKRNKEKSKKSLPVWWLGRKVFHIRLKNSTNIWLCARNGHTQLRRGSWMSIYTSKRNRIEKRVWKTRPVSQVRKFTTSETLTHWNISVNLCNLYLLWWIKLAYISPSSFL